MRIVTINARLLHDPRLGIADDGLTVDFGEFVNGLLPIALLQTHERPALEVIVGPAVFTPRKWILTVLTDLDAGLAVPVKLLADVVQKRRGNAGRNSTGCGRNHLVDRIVRLFN